MRLIKKIYWFSKALIANIIYNFPSKKITVIGITGTDGKTTVSAMVFSALKHLKQPCSIINTVNAQIGSETYATGFHVTTPNPFFIQRFLKKAVKCKNRFFVLEITSHAIDQMRIWGVHFKIAALTNITREHLDYHRSFRQYGRTKLKLLNSASIAVVNRDNPTHYMFGKDIKNTSTWYCSVNKKADFVWEELVKSGFIKDVAEFQKENYLTAYSVLRLLGFSKKQCAKALMKYKGIRGRMDITVKNNYTYIIDFAHTPYAFKKLFEAISKQKKYKRIIHVFGCAGERDKKKRSVMGRISAENSDLIILTEEDYRTENIQDIFNQIKKGIKSVKKHKEAKEEDKINGKCFYCEPDRGRAIALAVKCAGPKDVILLTGKAHEQSLARGRKEYKWDEFKAVENAIAQNS